MNTRLEQSQKKRRERQKQIWGIPKMLILLIGSFFIYLFSLIFWFKALNGTIYYQFLTPAITLNIMAIGLFMGLGYMNIKFLIILFKSFMKILFTLWLVIIIQFSPMDQSEQNVWILSSAFFFIYLEVLLEINDCLFQVKDDFKIPKIKFITATFIKENSLAISILCLSIINSSLSFSVVNLLDAIYPNV